MPRSRRARPSLAGASGDGGHHEPTASTIEITQGQVGVKRRLSSDEQELRSLGNLTLTTRRVIAYARRGRAEASTSLLLDHVQWTRLASEGHPTRATVALVLGALAIATLLGESLALGGVSSAAFVLAGLHAARRHTTVTIGAGHGRIKAWLDGDLDRRRQARSFLDAVDRAARAKAPPARPVTCMREASLDAG